MKRLLVSPSHKFGKKVLIAIEIRQLGLHILAVDKCVPTLDGRCRPTGA